MSLLSNGYFFFGIVLGGLLLLVIFSLLAMAQKGDAYQDQLEFELHQRRKVAPALMEPAKADNLGVPDGPGLGQAGAVDPRMLIGRKLATK